MRAFVITIPIKESEQVAERCIKSAARYGVTVEPVYGVTPKDDPVKIAEDLGIPTKGFVEVLAVRELPISIPITP